MSFSFSHKFSESTKATDILHHTHLMTVAVLVGETEAIRGPKVKVDKKKKKGIDEKKHQ